MTEFPWIWVLVATGDASAMRGCLPWQESSAAAGRLAVSPACGLVTV